MKKNYNMEIYSITIFGAITMISITLCGMYYALEREEWKENDEYLKDLEEQQKNTSIEYWKPKNEKEL